MSEREKESVAEMIGAFLREAAVLVLVFVPLEVYKSPPIRPLPWLLGVLAFSSVTLGLGIVLERNRE